MSVRVLLGCSVGVLLGCCQAFTELGQLDGLRLVAFLQLDQPFFEAFVFRAGFVQLRFKVIDSLRGIGKLALGLLALLACGSHNLGNPAISGLYCLVVQLNSQGGEAVSQLFRNMGHLVGHLHRQLGHRLAMRDGLAGFWRKAKPVMLRPAACSSWQAWMISSGVNSAGRMTYSKKLTLSL